MDVRRLLVRVGVHEVCVNVIRDGLWRFADVAVPGKTEQCRVALAGSELVRPPTPPRPPLDPDRRAYFCNNAPELEGYSYVAKVDLAFTFHGQQALLRCLRSRILGHAMTNFERIWCHGTL